MGLDLGALLSGITQGMGSAQDFKLAEEMRRAAEQRAFDQRRQLSSEGFDQRKQLAILASGLQGARQNESTRSGLEGELLRALGGAEGMGMPGLGAIPSDPGRIPTDEVQKLIGQLQAAAGLVSGAQTDRAKAPELAADIAAKDALAKSRGRANQPKPPRPEAPETEEDLEKRAKRVFDANAKEVKVRIDEIDKQIKMLLGEPLGYRKNKDQIDGLVAQKNQILGGLMTFEDALVQVGGGQEPGPIDIKKIIADEVSKQGQ